MWPVLLWGSDSIRCAPDARTSEKPSPAPCCVSQCLSACAAAAAAVVVIPRPLCSAVGSFSRPCSRPLTQLLDRFVSVGGIFSPNLDLLPSLPLPLPLLLLLLVPLPPSRCPYFPCRRSGCGASRGAATTARQRPRPSTSATIPRCMRRDGCSYPFLFSRSFCLDFPPLRCPVRGVGLLSPPDERQFALRLVPPRYSSKDLVAMLAYVGCPQRRSRARASVNSVIFFAL